VSAELPCVNARKPSKQCELHANAVRGSLSSESGWIRGGHSQQRAAQASSGDLGQRNFPRRRLSILGNAAASRSSSGRREQSHSLHI